MSSRPRLKSAQAAETGRVSASPPLLITRTEAARLLACSVSTLWRLERLGRIEPIKLHSSENGRTYYRRDALLALVQGR